MALPSIPKDSLKRLLQAVPRAVWTPLSISFASFVALIMLFGLIADNVAEHETTGFDEAVLMAVHSFASPFLDTAVSVLTELGGLIGVLTLTLGAMALLIVRRYWRRAVVLGITVLGASLLNLLLKAVFTRSRPDLWDHIVTELSYSFPSGHAMASMALGAGLVTAFWKTRFRWLTLSIAIFYVLGIAFTRLYLGVHYPTDILAGWCVSIAWAIVVGLLFTYRFRHRLPGVKG